MAIKSEIKQWMFHKVALLNHCFQVEPEFRIQWRKENHRTWRKPSVTNGLRILSNFGLIFQALHFQYIRFLFIHGQLCPYLRFYCLFEDFFNCFSLNTNISFSPSSGGNFRNDYSKYYKALC